ncbi:MAG: TIGR01459 family HAD-type hydrolase [Geminicoccaceae bacterium]|nr:TIGR01459 family HAD-type hydrolase [Geminicoccaceae bacterium]
MSHLNPGAATCEPEAAALPTIPVIEGLARLSGTYDGFIMDLWGVIHGGVEPYPGVVDTLERLRAADRSVVLLSNAPRRAASAVRRLRAIGIEDQLYRRLVTSGEVAHHALRDRPDEPHAALGRHYLYIGPEWDNDLVRELDYVAADDVASADFLLCVGLYDEADPLVRYDEMFEAAAARRLPMICVNPDLWVHRQSGVTSPCAGLLAERYQERHGGPVIYHGKPDPRVFHAAAGALDMTDGGRVLVIGDSLTTDIRGAAAAGFESLFVTRGIFASELGIEPGAEPDPEAVSRLCAQYGERPMAAIATLRW